MLEHPDAMLVRNLVEKLNSDDVAGVGELISDDIVWHSIGRSQPIRGKQVLMLALRAGGSADWTITAEIHDVTVGDGHVVALLETHATLGGKTLDARTAEIYHVKDGKVTAHWAFSDDTARILEFYA